MSVGRGVTLLESIIASFLLLVAFMITARLIDNSLRYQGWTDVSSLATLQAEQHLESLRRWAKAPSNFGNLESVYSPPVLSVGDFTLTTWAGGAIPLYSPCSELEANYPTTAERRSLKSSFKPVEVKVAWSRGEIILSSCLGDPPRTPRANNPLVIQGLPPGTLNRDQVVTLSAQLFDQSNQVIPDVFLQWSNRPVTGSGLLKNLARDGSTVQFQHSILLPDGSLGYSPGIPGPSGCQVYAGAFYRGREIVCKSSAIQLAP